MQLPFGGSEPHAALGRSAEIAADGGGLAGHLGAMVPLATMLLNHQPTPGDVGP